MSDAVLVTLIVVVGAIVLTAMIVMAKVIGNITEAMNDANDRTVTHMRSLTSQFADGCMAISEPNQQLLLRKLEVEQPVPDKSRPTVYPTEQQMNDINAAILAGPPMHGGDPNS